MVKLFAADAAKLLRTYFLADFGTHKSVIILFAAFVCKFLEIFAVLK